MFAIQAPTPPPGDLFVPVVHVARSARVLRTMGDDRPAHNP